MPSRGISMIGALKIWPKRIQKGVEALVDQPLLQTAPRFQFARPGRGAFAYSTRQHDIERMALQCGTQAIERDVADKIAVETEENAHRAPRAIDKLQKTEPAGDDVFFFARRHHAAMEMRPVHGPDQRQ